MDDKAVSNKRRNREVKGTVIRVKAIKIEMAINTFLR